MATNALLQGFRDLKGEFRKNLLKVVVMLQLIQNNSIEFLWKKMHRFQNHKQEIQANSYSGNFVQFLMHVQEV